MALTLDDITNAPSDPLELNKHLMDRGLIPLPPPPTPPVNVAPMSPVTPHNPVAPLVPPVLPNATAGAHIPEPIPLAKATVTPMSPLGANMAIGATAQPTVKPMSPVNVGAAPDLGGGVPESMGTIPGAESGGISPMVRPKAPTAQESIAAGMAQHGDTAKEEGKRQFNEMRPVVDAPVNSSEFWKQKISQDEFDKAHPWGGDISAHPGVLGKIGHTLGEVGQIAGGILAPGIVAGIPGTRLNRNIQEHGQEEQEGQAENRETAQASEQTREKHEENASQVNEQKLENAEDKLHNDQAKTLNERELGLRKNGLKPNPTDPTGPPIPLTREDMSEQEQAVLDLKGAQTDSAAAKAALTKIQADPNSPQSKQALQRIQIMAKNAGTAAEKLGLEKKKYLADYFGLDENLQPIAGTQTTPEGKPVGPKIAGSGQKALSEFNKNYEKPANDVETGYQKFLDARKDYDSGAPTGAASMVALSQHLATTFGSVKGARLNKDLIQEHKDAIGWLDRIERYGDMVGSGQQLSKDQWDDFGKLIGNTRKLAWQTAVKEAKRGNVPIDFLPKDLENEMGQKTKGGQNWSAPKDAPPAKGIPDGKVLKDASGQVIAKAKGGQWQQP